MDRECNDPAKFACVEEQAAVSCLHPSVEGDASLANRPQGRWGPCISNFMQTMRLCCTPARMLGPSGPSATNSRCSTWLWPASEIAVPTMCRSELKGGAQRIVVAAARAHALAPH